MHLGIIMDGNRRWAKEKGLPVFEGHREGAEKLIEVCKWCVERKISVLTVYAFSTENWGRGRREVDFLMGLMNPYYQREIQNMKEAGLRIKFIGQREKLSPKIQKILEKAEELTKDNNVLILNLAVSYGGRAEIARALKMMVQEGISPDDVTEEKIGEHLYTVGLPDPDLIIRTSGEMRTSGFLLWQSAYSELYFTDKYWPDFSEQDLDEALAEYARRQRRFGK